MRKKAAVEKYAATKEGKTQEEVMTEVLADEKGYTQEEAEEIVKAIFESESDEAISAEVVYLATQRMRTSHNADEFHEIGDDVSHYPAEKLAHLVSIGAVKKEE